MYSNTANLKVFPRTGSPYFRRLVAFSIFFPLSNKPFVQIVIIMPTRNGHAKRLSNGDLSETHLPKRSLLSVVAYGQRRLFLILAIGLTFVALLYTNMRYYQNRVTDYRLFYSGTSGEMNGKPDDKCHLPQLDPFDSSISSFVKKPEPLQCKKLQGELTYITEDGRLAINSTAMELESFSTNVDCKYRCFDRTEGLDDVTLNYSAWIQINDTPVVFAPDTCSFIDVACSRSIAVPIPVYSNTHARVIADQKRLKQLDERRERNSANWTPYSSVLLFILDSVSHSNFIRSLPKTLNVLKNLYNATVFDGFTKIGDNSLPNAVAFLTGKRVATAGYTSDLDDNMSQRFYDDWPFVWKEYAERGYVTMYAEDYPKYNLFQYLSNGFQRRPVDHYFRPFWVHAWTTFLHMRSTHLCYGNTPKHRLQLDYLRRFLTLYENRPFFAFNWMTELGHDWMNQIGLGDDDLSDFLTRMRVYLNNTAVVLLSDHGHRFDPIRQTVIGRIEERMPFFAIALPSSWRDSNSVQFLELERTLKRNSKLLTSPFDLHATLQHFLALSTGDKTYGKRGKKPNGTRGTSLFVPLPPDRQCQQAHVPEEFCVCQKEILIANASTDEKVQRAVEAVIDHLNQLLSSMADRCAVLRLLQILQAQTFLPNLNAIEDGRVSIIYGGRRPSGFYVNYRVTFVTSPGGAVFESAVRYSLTEDTFKVIGDVNRINKYGDQSDCIQSVLLRKFCYCHNRTDVTASGTS